MLRLKHLFALSTIFLGVFLAGCGGPAVSRPPDWGVGLDAIAPDGRWGTIVEHNGDPPACHLAVVELGAEAGKTYDLKESTPCSYNETRPQSSFSPDGDYLLYRIAGGWGITKATVPFTPTTWLASDQEMIQFLPNGRLLVISTTNDLGESSFFEVDRYSMGRTPLLDRVHHIFSVQRPLGTAEPLPCSDPSPSERALWITVDADNNVAILDIQKHDSDPPKPTPQNAPGLIEVVTTTISLERERSRAQIVKETPAAGKQLTAQEVEVLLDSPTAAAEIASRARRRLEGVPSPDGTKLLLLESDSGERSQELYTLFLIDLQNGAGRKTLSAGSEWKPSFSFSPDGRQILYESNLIRAGARALYLANSDGSGTPRSVARDGTTPCWYARK